MKTPFGQELPKAGRPILSKKKETRCFPVETDEAFRKKPLRIKTEKVNKMPSQKPRRETHARLLATEGPKDPRRFDYSHDYKSLDLRLKPELYRVGVGEQGVLLVEPYKSEILPSWKFRNPEVAGKSADEITKLFLDYAAAEDFVGMDMARKFLQMGYTRSRRYANHASGKKYSEEGGLLPFANDDVKARSAEIFWLAWQSVEHDMSYAILKLAWRDEFG